MKSRLVTLSLFSFLLAPTILPAQQNFRSKVISTNYGLSQSFVHALAQDNSGFVWAGTQDGLNRFDGYSFKQYHKHGSDTTSLSSNYIWSLHTGADETLWIGTTNGVSTYDPTTDQFRRYPIPSDDPKQQVVRSIHALSSQAVLVGTTAGVFLLDPTTADFQQLHAPSPTNLDNSIIYSINPISDERLLIGTRDKLFVYYRTAQQIHPLHTEADLSGGITGAFLDADLRLWLGTGNGLWQMDLREEQDSLLPIQHFKHEEQNPQSISSNYITSLHTDREGGVWIGTNVGINYLNTQRPENGFRIFLPDAEHPTSLRNYVFDLLEVEPNILWAATQDGIFQLHTHPPIVQSFDITESEEALGSMSMHGMVEQDDQNLLIATEKGLLSIDVETDAMPVRSVLNVQNTPSLADEFLVNISPAQGHGFWIALRRGGFGKLSPTATEEYHWQGFQLPAGQYRSVGCNDLLETDDGKLWIASSGIGLWCWNQGSDTYQSFQKSATDSSAISGNYIFQLYQDSKRQLWVATADGGLCRKAVGTDEFTCFTYSEGDPSSISSNMVLSIFEDSQERIWVCTADGLNLLEDNVFQRFGTQDGLPNNVIYGMLEDEQGYLWVSTDRGLSRINYQQEQFSYLNFSVDAGLLKPAFNQHAFLRRSNGQLVFGTIGGLNFLHPTDIQAYTVAPQVVLTDFKLFNESATIGADETRQNDYQLPQHINHLDHLILPYEQDFLAFEFAGITFEEASANQYAYQLVGLDNNWVYCGERRFANYPGLRPGTYTFRVKAANHDGVWSAQEKTIKLTLETPPWRRPWAYVLYVLGISGAVYGFFRYRLHNLRQIEQAKEQERVTFRKRSARDFHDEAGNQITKISLVTEIAKRQSSENSQLKGLLQQIEEDVQQLRSGMRDFIWVLDPDNDNLFNTLLRLKEFAHQHFEYSPIQFSASAVNESYKACQLNGTQRRNILLIFKEAMNNALKYSQAQSAQLDFTRTDSVLTIRFADSGQGFDTKLGRSIGYGLTNMQSRAEKIGATLAISSDTGQGTRVSLQLKITQMGN